MSSSLTSILTISAMLLHSILGCCWHHAHACEHGVSVGDCAVEHDEHHSVVPEAAHDEHEAGDHQNCSGVDAHAHHGHGNVDHDTPLVANEDGHRQDDSSRHQHDSCPQNCEGGDCSFTQSPQVKTPAPDDGQLSFPFAAAILAGAPMAGHLSAHYADSGPPGSPAASCCRTMTQVWRL
ncbi:MAG: hypothetical protein O3B13_11630 [Planctomycetota bacterium]|nr:hypothetical protein [Planctomycetota bacterium]